MFSLELGTLTIFLKWANPSLFFVYFRSFPTTISIQIEKSIDGVLGIRTRGRRMVGADKTTELWRPPLHCNIVKYAICVVLNDRDLF